MDSSERERRRKLLSEEEAMLSESERQYEEAHRDV
jgi:hypothetical protein